MLGPQEDRPLVLSLGPPRALGFCTESGAQRRLKVTRWTAGSGLGLSQVPRLHPCSRPRSAAVGRRGSRSPTGPSLGTEGPFFAAQQSPCLPRARLQPPSSPADEEDLGPASTNMRAFCREAAIRLSNRVGGFKGPEGSQDRGRASCWVLSLKYGRGTNIYIGTFLTRYPQNAHPVCSGEGAGGIHRLHCILL